jgi:membrane protein DedA with SNARE-associated domain
MATISGSLAEILRHGYLVLLTWLALEQLGAPLPAMPLLIAAGVLSGAGRLSLPMAFALGILGCLIGDTAWYAIGKRQGTAVLRILCKISLEPETCVRRSASFISRHGSRALLFTKFIPGISAVAVPLTANSRISLPSFFFYDALGSAAYVGAYLVLGRLIGDRIDRLSVVAYSMTGASAVFVLIGSVGIVAWRLRQRGKFRHDVQLSRIRPEELLALIEAGQNPFIVDLRHVLDMLPDPRVIPGAVRLTPEELTSRQQEIPRDREVILYCT